MNALDYLLQELSLAFKHAGSREQALDYVLSSLAMALAASSAAALVAIAFGAGLPPAAIVFVACFALLSAFFYSLPFWRASQRAQELEAELAFALKQIAVCLDCGISFEKALEAASRGKGALALELRQALQQTRSGAGLRNALASVCDRTNSQLVKRSALALINSYEIGAAQGLRRLGSEATALQLARAKEFNSRQGFYSVFFITASAVLPAAFAAFSTVGAIFLGFEISPALALAVFAIVFPALNALLLSLLYLQSPKLLLGR